MSKIGTCRWAYQIQERWIISAGPDYSHPHTPPAERHEIWPDAYTCQWLDGRGPLPPPIQRCNGVFVLRAEDCDGCPHYEPASTFPAKR